MIEGKRWSLTMVLAPSELKGGGGEKGKLSRVTKGSLPEWNSVIYFLMLVSEKIGADATAWP